MPLRVVLEGSGWSEKREITAPGPVELALPPVTDRDEIIELRLDGKGLRADPSVLGIRVDFGEAP